MSSGDRFEAPFPVKGKGLVAKTYAQRLKVSGKKRD